MKKLFFLVFLTTVLLFPCYSQDDINYTKDYIDATQKKPGNERIEAFKAYVQKYPDTTQKFTKLAYYWMTVDTFMELKNYSESIKLGEKTLKLDLSDVGEGTEEGRILLILANSYGMKGATFNKDKALQYCDKAIASGKAAKDQKVVKTAQDLKAKLDIPDAPPPKQMTPAQKIQYAYSNESYTEVINTYKTFSEADKKNPETWQFYASSLFKSGQADAALKEFEALYAKSKKGIVATRIAEIYEAKAKGNKALIDTSATYYLESNLLYQKENNSANQKAAFQKAQFMIGEKYDYNKKALAYQKKQGTKKNTSQVNTAKIAQLEKELKKVEKEIQKYELQEMEAPGYVTDKKASLEKQLEQAKAGGSAEPTNSADVAEFNELTKIQGQINTEIQTFLAKAKKNLGM